MTAPPIRRLVATAGLLVLAPVGAMLALGSLSPEDAAVRAAATLVVCLVVGRALTVGIRSLIPIQTSSVGETTASPVGDPAGVDEVVEGQAGQRGNASSAASITTGSNAEPAA